MHIFYSGRCAGRCHSKDELVDVENGRMTSTCHCCKAETLTTVTTYPYCQSEYKLPSSKYNYSKAPNFCEHLIFPQIREGACQGGEGLPWKLKVAITSLLFGLICKLSKVTYSVECPVLRYSKFTTPEFPKLTKI